MTSITDTNLSIRALLDICKILMECGTEISKVEESAIFLCNVFKIKDTQVFVLPHYMTISYSDSTNQTVTKTLRYQNRGTDLSCMEDTLNLIKNIEGKQLYEVFQKIDEIEKKAKKHNTRREVVAYIGVAGSSAYLSHLAATPICDILTIKDRFITTIGAALCSLSLLVMDRLIARTRISDIFAKLFEAIVLASTTFCYMLMSQKLVPAQGIGMMSFIITGNIMLLVPGIKFTNGIRSLFTNDQLSALIQSVGAVISTIGIALGIGAMLYALRPWIILVSVSNPDTSIFSIFYMLWMGFMSGVSSLFFALYFKATITSAIHSLYGGWITAVVQYAVYYLLRPYHLATDSVLLFISVTIAAMCAGGIGYWLEKCKGLPKTVFIFTAILPLIPGAKLYESIYKYLNSINEASGLASQAFISAAQPMMQAFIIAAGIAFGIAFLSVIVQFLRAVLTYVNHEKRLKTQRDQDELDIERDISIAQKYFQTGLELRHTDYEKALEYFGIAERCYDVLLNKAKKSKSKHLYTALANTAENKYWIFRLHEDFCLKNVSARENLIQAKELYNEAKESNLKTNHAHVLNWIGVLGIAEARNEMNSKTKFHQLILQARNALQTATKYAPDHALIHINLAETYMTEMLFELGLDYMEPLYQYHRVHSKRSININKLKQLASFCDKELDEAIRCDSQIINAYYKHGQLCSLLMLIATTPNEKMKNREQAESWFAQARYIDEHDMSYLYTYRQFCECFDIKKAREVNKMISMRNKPNACRWKSKTDNLEKRF